LIQLYRFAGVGGHGFEILQFCAQCQQAQAEILLLDGVH
jgi:hypothetical protein